MISDERVLKAPIRWAMVGGGRGSSIGYIHRSAAQRDGNFRLVAGAFDIDADRGRDFGVNLGVAADRCYPDYKTLFAEEANRADGIQAVSIATPNGTHYEISKAALEAGLHVVCEKPLCFEMKQAEELERLAVKNKRIFGVMYGYTGHQMVMQARKMVERGDLGKIRIVQMQFAHGGCNVATEANSAAQKWRTDPKIGGPSFILGDVGTHAFYLGELICPELKVESLLCSKQIFVEGRELEDNAFVLLNYEGGAKGTLWASGVNCGVMHGQKIRVIGEKASIEWWNERPNQLKYEVQGSPTSVMERGEGYIYPEAMADDRISGGHVEGLFESWANLYRRFALVMEAANEGDYKKATASWYPSVHDGAEGVRFIEKCIASADAGSVWIDW
ncbi:MAG: Gfo/Idh/MocA family protein [Lachnospiraceae bacterium]